MYRHNVGLSKTTPATAINTVRTRTDQCSRFNVSNTLSQPESKTMLSTTAGNVGRRRLMLANADFHMGAGDNASYELRTMTTLRASQHPCRQFRMFPVRSNLCVPHDGQDTNGSIVHVRGWMYAHNQCAPLSSCIVARGYDRA